MKKPKKQRTIMARWGYADRNNEDIFDVTIQRAFGVSQ
jgi:hypothetical protein